MTQHRSDEAVSAISETAARLAATSTMSYWEALDALMGASDDWVHISDLRFAVARADRAETSLRSLQSWAEGARTDLADMTEVVAERDALRAQVRAVEAACAKAVQVLWPSANGYPSGWSLDPDAIRDALAAGLSLQEEQE